MSLIKLGQRMRRQRAAPMARQAADASRRRIGEPVRYEALCEVLHEQECEEVRGNA